jgi:hypothetical protein
MLVKTVDFVIPPFVKVFCGDRVTNYSPNDICDILIPMLYLQFHPQQQTLLLRRVC